MSDGIGSGESLNHRLTINPPSSWDEPRDIPSNKALVLMVGAKMEHGGQQQHLLDLASGLQNLAGRPVVVATPGGPLVQELIGRGVRHETIPSMSHNPATLWRTGWYLNKLARQYGAVIIHTHTRYHNLPSLLATTIFRTPVVRVATAHNVFPDKHWSGFWPRDTICVSQPVEDYVQRHSRAVTRVIVDGVPLFTTNLTRANARAAFNLSDDEVVVLNVGRLSVQKAQSLLILAFEQALVTGATPPMRLLLVGDGPLHESLKKQVDYSPHKSKIKLMGDLPRETVGALMRAADMLVLSSLWEGLGMVLLEAASESLPLVSFNVGGVTEIVRDGETGLLVAPQDVKALSNAIVKLGSNRPLRQHLGSKANQVYQQRFTLEKCILDTDFFYEDILAIAPPGKLSVHNA